MPSEEIKALLRALPSVEQVLRSPKAAAWLALLPRRRVVPLVRGAISELRQTLLSGQRPPGKVDQSVADLVSARVGQVAEPSLRSVINASGVILHTNLGRAPLGAAAARAIAGVATRYCNLEFDLARGRRGRRDDHCGPLLEALLGAPALVVNNNAAAVFLVVHELARDGEVLVSRGELVEIGDGFRIQEILEASQTRVREVGSTNRTHLHDYSAAIDRRTRMVLRVHPSNFRQVGFTGRPRLADLVELAHRAEVPMVEDLGSGCLSDGPWPGIEGEPPVTRSLAAGVDLVTCSGDKLLGGPQAGIITGRADLVRRIRRNPLFRALRVDKLTIAALGATLRAYARGREDQVPALRMARTTVSQLKRRCERLAGQLADRGVLYTQVEQGESLLGGGSTPMQRIPSVLVTVSGTTRTSSAIERRLRSGTPPVIARIERDRLLLDLRTVNDDQEAALVAAVARAVDDMQQE